MCIVSGVADPMTAIAIRLSQANSELECARVGYMYESITLAFELTSHSIREIFFNIQINYTQTSYIRPIFAR